MRLLSLSLACLGLDRGLLLIMHIESIQSSDSLLVSSLLLRGQLTMLHIHLQTRLPVCKK